MIEDMFCFILLLFKANICMSRGRRNWPSKEEMQSWNWSRKVSYAM